MSDRVPHPVKEVFKRLNIETSKTSLDNHLSNANYNLQIVQEFKPISQNLEWELSHLHWNKEGLLPFVENSVPFIVNNSGRLSEIAAAVLFNSCEESSPDKILLLELGAGTGLFARYLLDAFKLACKQENKDYYDRVVFYVSDNSSTTVFQWNERKIFSDHENHVVLGVCNGLEPSVFTSDSGEKINLSGLKTVYCNYMLDILPTTVLKQKKDGFEELRIRTLLNTNSGIVAQYTTLTFDQIRDIVESEDPEQLSQLIPLMDVFEYETKYFSVDKKEVPFYQYAMDFGKNLERVMVNYGAINCIEKCLELLSMDGYMLINDYGPAKPEHLNDWSPSQRFGSTVANGLNFPMLDHIYKDSIIAPLDCQDAPVQARLIMSNSNMQATRDSFLDRFGMDASKLYESDLLEARQHCRAGRKNDALKSYKIALEYNLKDWHVLGEIGEFLIMQLQDYSAGVELTQHALLINSWYSAWLWNVMGDGLFCLKKNKESHEAYLQAQRINPSDVRVNLNLAYTYFQDGLHDDALQAIARGLTHDVRSQYRDRLLEKQQQILAAISGKFLGEQERLANRSHRIE